MGSAIREYSRVKLARQYKLGKGLTHNMQFDLSSEPLRYAEE